MQPTTFVCNYCMYAVPKIALDHSSMSSLCKLQCMHSHPNNMIFTIMQVLLADATVRDGFMEQPQPWSLTMSNSLTGLLSLPIFCYLTATSNSAFKMGWHHWHWTSASCWTSGKQLTSSTPALLHALQDFLKEVDVRFMDQLRRGASIVATDLARAPQPASLRDCYQLMCLTAPEVDQIEASISTIKEEIDMRKAAVADKEALLANHNPPVFQAVQVCPPFVQRMDGTRMSLRHCECKSGTRMLP